MPVLSQNLKIPMPLEDEYFNLENFNSILKAIDNNAGKSGDSIKVIGTVPNNGAVTIVPGSTDQQIMEGYHDGNGKVLGDPNLLPENIMSGKSIFGVLGISTIGKRYAHGANATLNSSYKFTITGLDFTPSIVIGMQGSDPMRPRIGLYVKEFNSTYQFSVEVGKTLGAYWLWTEIEKGFTLRVGSTENLTDVSWWAFE